MQNWQMHADLPETVEFEKRHQEIYRRHEYRLKPTHPTLLRN
jgi:hypothetical protein